METKVAKKSVEPKNDESKVYIGQEKIEDPNTTEQENTPTNSKGRTIKNIPNHITELALILQLLLLIIFVRKEKLVKFQQKNKLKVKVIM